MSKHVVSVESLSLLHLHHKLYLLPVMVHGWVKRPPYGQTIYMFLQLWKLRARLVLSLWLFWLIVM